MPGPSIPPSRTAAFFDVDGTLVQSTIVHYYIYFRRQRMSPIPSALWYGSFLLKCLYYLALDKIDRAMLNRVFYRSYRGLLVQDIRQQVPSCYENVIEPHLFPKGVRCVEQHSQAGRSIVLVTGSIDFIMEPLADRLGVDQVIAGSLVEAQGRFTGELQGPPIGAQEKAHRIRAFAAGHDIDLAGSFAYGDSIADLAMLESVGNPCAVNPDRALAAAAQSRGWPMCHWTLRGKEDGRL